MKQKKEKFTEYVYVWIEMDEWIDGIVIVCGLKWKVDITLMFTK